MYIKYDMLRNYESDATLETEIKSNEVLEFDMSISKLSAAELENFMEKKIGNTLLIEFRGKIKFDIIDARVTHSKNYIIFFYNECEIRLNISDITKVFFFDNQIIIMIDNEKLYIEKYYSNNNKNKTIAFSKNILYT